VSVSLKATADREVARQRYADRHAHALDGLALLREVQRAVNAHASVRGRLSKDEREAVAQLIVMQLVQRGWHGRPRDVLAWIDRAERMPTVAQEDYRRMVVRTLSGGDWLTNRIARVVHESREWRDVAATFTKRQRKDRGDVSGVTLEAWETADNATGAVAHAVASHVAPDVALLPEDVRTYAGDAADRIASDHWRMADADRRRIEVALLIAGGVTLSTVARASGRTVGAVKTDAHRGRAILLARFPESSNLIDYLRSVAPADPPPAQAAETVALDVRVSRDRQPVSTGRPLDVLAWIDRQLARVALADLVRDGRPQVSPVARSILRTLDALSMRVPTPEAHAGKLPDAWRGLDVGGGVCRPEDVPAVASFRPGPRTQAVPVEAGRIGRPDVGTLATAGGNVARVLTGKYVDTPRTGRPRDVLAWIARAERIAAGMVARPTPTALRVPAAHVLRSARPDRLVPAYHAEVLAAYRRSCSVDRKNLETSTLDGR
jgi:hypothetical protein